MMLFQTHLCHAPTIAQSTHTRQRHTDGTSYALIVLPTGDREKTEFDFFATTSFLFFAQAQMPRGPSPTLPTWEIGAAYRQVF